MQSSSSIGHPAISETMSNTAVGSNLFDLIPKLRVRNWKIITYIHALKVVEVGFVLQMTRKPVHNNFVQRWPYWLVYILAGCQSCFALGRWRPCDASRGPKCGQAWDTVKDKLLRYAETCWIHLEKVGVHVRHGSSLRSTAILYYISINQSKNGLPNNLL